MPLFYTPTKVLIFCCAIAAGVSGVCKFPDFLWYLSAGSAPQRVWLTETKYTNSTTWESRRRVVAKQITISVFTQLPWPCGQQDSNYCLKGEHKIMCMEDKGGDIYRVRQLAHGLTRFMCSKFVRRNDNIVQVWMSDPSDTNDADLCGIHKLHRSEWPWIAETHTEWSPCPIVGGYDFWSYITDRKKKLCHRVWRPSLLESECVSGEGLQFTFPEKSCSFFYGRQLNVLLQCWASWEEEHFTFIVAGQANFQPQYVLRLASDFAGLKTRDMLDGRFYMSPVVPVSVQGDPPGHVQHVKLQLDSSAACFDEKAECLDYAESGICMGDNIRVHGPSCRKSCGLCAGPSNATECDFPLDYHGEWLLFERDRKETVTIGAGIITFSTLGSFICKSRHWKQNQMKFLSVFKNGCRPRYTCMDFSLDEREAILKFRVSRSSFVDRSFDLCEFEADPNPTADRFRSSKMKLMFPVSRAIQHSCGLGGLVDLQATMEGGHSCHGSMTDWNPFSCTLVDTLVFSLTDCPGDPTHAARQFNCQARMAFRDDYQVLFTQEETLDGRPLEYQCWLIKLTGNDSRTGDLSRTHWRQAFILKRTHCGVDGDLDPEIYKASEVSFQIRNEQAQQHCLVVDEGGKPHSSSVRYLVKKNIRQHSNTHAHTAQHGRTAVDAWMMLSGAVSSPHHVVGICPRLWLYLLAGLTLMLTLLWEYGTECVLLEFC